MLKPVKLLRLLGALGSCLLMVACLAGQSHSALDTPSHAALLPTLRLDGNGRLLAGGRPGSRLTLSDTTRGVLDDDIALLSARSRVDPASKKVTLTVLLDGRIWAVVFEGGHFVDLRSRSDRQRLWLEATRRKALAEVSSRAPQRALGIDIPIEFPEAIRRFVGGEKPRLNVSGRRKISLSGRSEWTEGQAQTATSRPSKFPALAMKQQSNFRVEGTVGRKIHVQVDQDTERFSDIENTIKLRYDGDEDEVIQEVEAGNTMLSLPSTQFVGYSAQHKGLFGIRAKAKLGGIDLVAIASQEKSSGQRKSYRGLAEETSAQIRDYQYLSRTYFFVDPRYRQQYKQRHQEGFRPASEDSIVAIQVYVDDRNSSNDIEQRAIAGWAFSDVSNPDSATTGYYEEGNFYELEAVEDYLVEEGYGYIVLRSSSLAQDNYVLAVAFRTASGETHGDVDFSPGDSLITLQLVKARNQRPGYPTWPLEWKNVYDLGGRDINPDGFEITILKDMAGQDPLESQNGVSFLQVFGLDTHGRDPGSAPDNLIDLDHTIVDLRRGELIFPDLAPFDPDTTQHARLDDTVPEIYTTHDAQTRRNASRYFIQVSSQSRQTRVSLGQMGILDGTEQVMLNNRRLARGVDYQINYFTGEVTFLTDEILDPTAPLVIDYEYASLFMPQQKTLLGLRTEQKFWGNSSWGTTLLYNSERSAEERVKVGQEPGRTLIWDTDLNLSLRSQLLTRALDALPLVKTSAPSSVDLSAEIAQSLPNPNTKGKAYVDDFEGAANQTSLGIMRGLWTQSSPPEGREEPDRGGLTWYNPWDRILIKDIWPNKETGGQVENEINVLSLEFAPDTTAASPHDSWAGIMRALPAGGSDFSRSKFLEVWVRGDEGVLNVDLGTLSEDIDSDDRLDSEDREVFGQRDGILDLDEDVGLDGRNDLKELHHYLDEKGQDTTGTAQQKRDLFLEEYPGRDPDDPEGDNWRYEYETRYDYSHINGTQNNRDDPDRGIEPDTEDINRSGYLDTRNDYYHYEIDLDPFAGGYLVEGTEYKGWRLYRVPLWGSDSHEVVGTPDPTLIEYARIWVAGADGPITVDIATVEVAGNNWQESGIATADSDFVALDETFGVTVKGTDKDQNYDPPPGVEAEIDPATGVREREQSLVLQFENLGPGHMASAYRSFPQKADYTRYETMTFFVRGENTDLPFATSDSSWISFFIRLGADEENYYEYTTDVVEGWKPVSVDLGEFPKLKSAMEDTSWSPASPQEYAVGGDPSLTNVKWITIGITNTHREGSFSGEVWVDELCLDHVRRDAGTARRVALDLGLADLMSLSASYLQQDPHFRDLKSKSGSGRDRRSQRFRGDIRIGRFLPEAWRVSMPLSVSWENTIAKPRFSSGSDIELDSDQSHEERTEKTRRSLNASFSKTSSKHWLPRITLDRINASFTYSSEDGVSPQRPESRSWSSIGKFSYDLSPRASKSVKVFGWMPSFVPNALRDAQLRYLPTKASFDAQANITDSWDLDVNRMKTTKSDSSLTQEYKLGVSPFRRVTADYSLKLKSDMRKGLNMGLRNFRLGTEIDRTQNASLLWETSAIQWLKQSYSYRASYHESNDPRFRQTEEEAAGRDVDAKGTASAKVTLDLPRLFGPFLQSPNTRSGQAGSGGAASDQEGQAAKKGRLRRLVGGLAGKVKPARLTYARTNTFKHNGLIGRPTGLYQLGLSSDPGVPGGATGPRRDSESATDKFSSDVGIDLLTNVSVKTGYDYTYDFKRNANSFSATEKQTFPQIQISWDALEKLPLLSRAARSSDADLGYSRTRTARGDPGENRRLIGDQLTSEVTTEDFSPLLSWKVVWNNGISSTFKVTRGEDEQTDYMAGQPSGKTHTKSAAYTATVTYKLSPKEGLRFPLMGKRINLKSSVDLSLDVNLKHDLQEMAKGGAGYVTHRDEAEWSVGPKASYQFSKSFTGGANILVAQRKDRKTDLTRKTREVGIWGEIRF